MADSDLEAVRDFRSELRISPFTAIALLFASAVLIFAFSGMLFELNARYRALFFAGLVLLLSISALFLYRWRVIYSRIGRIGMAPDAHEDLPGHQAW